MEIITERIIDYVESLQNNDPLRFNCSICRQSMTINECINHQGTHLPYIVIHITQITHENLYQVIGDFKTINDAQIGVDLAVTQFKNDKRLQYPLFTGGPRWQVISEINKIGVFNLHVLNNGAYCYERSLKYCISPTVSSELTSKAGQNKVGKQISIWMNTILFWKT